MTDDHLVAAHLTAAIIPLAPIASGDAAENAVQLYFEVLEALQAKSGKRPSPTKRKGDPVSSRRDVF
jgi:hypothetical protein